MQEAKLRSQEEESESINSLHTCKCLESRKMEKRKILRLVSGCRPTVTANGKQLDIPLPANYTSWKDSIQHFISLSFSVSLSPLLTPPCSLTQWHGGWHCSLFANQWGELFLVPPACCLAISAETTACQFCPKHSSLTLFYSKFTDLEFFLIIQASEKTVGWTQIHISQWWVSMVRSRKPEIWICRP